jgi:hypothetical protein
MVEEVEEVEEVEVVEVVEVVVVAVVAVVAVEAVGCMGSQRNFRCTPIRSRCLLHYRRSGYTAAFHTLTTITDGQQTNNTNSMYPKHQLTATGRQTQPAKFSVHCAGAWPLVNWPLQPFRSQFCGVPHVLCPDPSAMT